MSAHDDPNSEASLLLHAESLLAGVAAGETPLPDVPALEGTLFRSLLERVDEEAVDAALRRAAATGALAEPVPGEFDAGDRLASVRLVSVLGEGGMGRVFRGEDEKLGRPVAVKTIRARARFSPSARARFHREARLLSRLNHPAICQIYDLVQRPEADYLLLELVEGETLRDWIARAPPAGERLATAIAIVEAVAFAHRAGVVHRDLKPDNVMRLAEGGIKILDFGIARSDDGELGSPAGQPGPAAAGSRTAPLESGATPGPPAPFETELGSVVGTPAYMSPEQARGEPATAAADVWALGVLFHELFAASRPVAAAVAPTGDDGGTGVRVTGGLDRELSRLLESMLAIEPADRPSAESVQARLLRLARRPVRRRNRAAAALLATLAVAGAARYVVDVRAERVEAIAARDEAEEVAGFLVSIFEIADPRQSLGEEVTARQLLDRGAARVAELRERPLVRARLEATLGAVYTALGLNDEAAPHLERALLERRSLLGDGDPETLATVVGWAELELRRGKVEAAERDVDGVIDLMRAVAAGAERDQLLVDALNVRGTARRELGRLAEAEADRREALALVEAGPGVSSPPWAVTASGLALVLYDQGRVAEAEPLARKALTIFEASLPESHPDRNTAMNNLALILTDLGRSDEALAILREELELDTRSLGPDHSAVGISHDNLALALFRLGRLEEAEVHVRRAVEIFTAAGGEHHLYLGTAFHNLGVLARELGRPEEAVDHLERAIAIYRSSLGDETTRAAGSLRALAAVYERQERFGEAAPLLAEAWAIEEMAQAEGGEPSIGTLCRLARAEAAAGRRDAGERAARRALEIGEAAWGADDERLAPAFEALDEILGMKGDAAGAAEARARRANLTSKG